MSVKDELLSLIGQQAIVWEQGLEQEDALKARADFEEFKRKYSPQLPFASQEAKELMESYDNLLPRFPQFRP